MLHDALMTLTRDFSRLKTHSFHHQPSRAKLAHAKRGRGEEKLYSTSTVQVVPYKYHTSSILIASCDVIIKRVLLVWVVPRARKNKHTHAHTLVS